MSELTRTLEEAVEEANSKGLIVCEPAPNELQLDIDSAEIPESLVDKITEMRAYDLVEKVTKNRSASGVNWHVRVFLREPITDAERVMWQAVLESDPRREYLSAMRLGINSNAVSLFFEKPAYEATLEPLESPELLSINGALEPFVP